MHILSRASVPALKSAKARKFFSLSPYKSDVSTLSACTVGYIIHIRDLTELQKLTKKDTSYFDPVTLSVIESQFTQWSFYSD